VAGDVERVRAIVEAAYARWVDELGIRPIPLDDDYAARIAAAEAWVTGEPVSGVIVLRPGDGFLLVDNVAVDPDTQGQGIGRLLLAFAEEQARAACFPEVRLYTNERMTANIRLYERSGYRQLGRETIHGRHAVWMGKALSY
jgi:ribosomal protein S18 acetylase RimI-like enzyme